MGWTDRSALQSATDTMSLSSPQAAVNDLPRTIPSSDVNSSSEEPAALQDSASRLIAEASSWLTRPSLLTIAQSTQAPTSQPASSPTVGLYAGGPGAIARNERTTSLLMSPSPVIDTSILILPAGIGQPTTPVKDSIKDSIFPALPTSNTDSITSQNQEPVSCVDNSKVYWQ